VKAEIRVKEMGARGDTLRMPNSSVFTITQIG